jgi:hypothetical protein
MEGGFVSVRTWKAKNRYCVRIASRRPLWCDGMTASRRVRPRQGLVGPIDEAALVGHPWRVRDRQGSWATAARFHDVMRGVSAGRRARPATALGSRSEAAQAVREAGGNARRPGWPTQAERCRGPRMPKAFIPENAPFQFGRIQETMTLASSRCRPASSASPELVGFKTPARAPWSRRVRP